MRKVAALAAAGMAASASAAPIALKPLIDARLRYEHVDQDGIAGTSDAITLRARTGIEAKSGPFSALIEAESTIALAGPYNDGFNGRALPLVGDAQNVELNRAQLKYASKPLTVTAGRQRIELADSRFVGSAPWRQNEQTFDAVRVQLSPAKRVSLDATYSWSVRTTNGIQGVATRPQAVRGDNWFGVASYAAPVGTLSAFAILVDQDSAALQGYRLSSQTYGLRFARSQPIGKGWKLGYIASAARQSDYAHNPNHYAATYALGEASLTGKVVNAMAGYEVLGADKGVALTSVQTPLASYFRFNGWASKFTTTPPNGLRDAYATLSANWKAKGWLTGYGLGATFHRFDSDRLSQHYGDEFDLIASARLKRTVLALRYAHYAADSFATDTDKLFVTVDWSLG
jgi:hypothetical protein